MSTAHIHTRTVPLGMRLPLLIALWAGLAVFLSVLPGHADDSADVAAARTVITEQIEAFRRDDVARAVREA